MTKFEFSRDHARKLAEALYPADHMRRYCVEPCEVCDLQAEEWNETIERVFKALKTLED